MLWKVLGGLAVLAAFVFFKKRRNKQFVDRLNPKIFQDTDYIDYGSYKIPLKAWENPKLWGKIEVKPF